jgi:FkbM family methyltransferase
MAGPNPFFSPQPNPLEVMQQQLAMLLSEQRRTSARLYSLEAADALRTASRAPRRTIEFRSQFGEDTAIWDLCERRLTGFYIEVGAFDGYHFSATYALDCIGWNGLLIEAIPERYQECVKRRPDARVVHAALAGPGSFGDTQFTVTQDPLGGMLSYLKATPEHARRVENTSKRAVTVPLTTMNELLKDFPGEIDAAVIDVEGGEIALLQGFDLARHRPKVLLIEDNAPSAPNFALESMMSKAGYSLVTWVAVSRVYLRNDLAANWSRRQ